MKKTTFYASLMLAASLALASCEKPDGPDNTETTPLATPVLAYETTETGFTVTWEAVENADSYIYRLDEGNEQTTTQCEAVFTDMAPGTYKVDVKAAAPAGSDYTDSKWASVSVTVENGEDPDDDWFNVGDPYLSTEFGFNTYECICFDITGHDVAALQYAAIRTEEAEGLSDEEILERLTISADEYSLATLNEEGLTHNVLFADPETSYVVGAYATRTDGVTKLVVTNSVTTDPEPEMDPALAAWIGTYTVTSTEQMEIAVDESGVVTLKGIQEPMEFEISITKNSYSTLAITGFSQYDPTIADYAVLTEDGGLQMLCAVVATGTWMPICSTSDGTYTFVNGTPYIFTFYNNDGVITSQACSGDLQDGRTYTVYAADVFSISGNQVNIPHELPAYLPAGELTLVKTSSENTSAKLSTSVTGRKAAGNATTTSLSSARQ